MAARPKTVTRVAEANYDAREHRLFNSLDLDNDGFIRRSDFESALLECGLSLLDPRLQGSIAALREWEVKNPHQAAEQGIPRDAFCSSIRQNILLIERALQGNLIIPDFNAFCKEIDSLFLEAKADERGDPADYIPQLKLEGEEANRFGVSVCTVDGQRYSIGDCRDFFTVQSTCKPINYCLALEEHGEDFVHRFIGREPSGASFNALTLNTANQPHNPLINAGAIMACSLIKLSDKLSGNGGEGGLIRGWSGRRFDYVLDCWAQLAGGERPRFNNSVYLSERETADRNFALAYFMREKKAFPPEAHLLDVLELYFQCCSIEINTELMSVVAATLANGGICPTSDQRVLSKRTVQHCLSLMYSCGMYDFSGEFAFTIGLPAKSGVSGALIIVVPNVMGICTWSPRLDDIGNSVRGIRFSQELVRRFNFHNYDIVGDSSGKRDPRINTIEAQSKQLNGLIWAATKGDVSAIQRLVMLDAELNAADYDLRTPLHLAAAEGQVAVVEFFIRQNGLGGAIMLSPEDRWGGTPLDDADAHGHKDVQALLESAGAIRGKKSEKRSGLAATPNAAPQADPERIVELIWAAATGDLRAILRLVARGQPLDCADYDFRTPLHLAASEGHVDIVRFLLSRAVKVDPLDRWGNSPADDAKRHGHKVVLELLHAHAPAASSS